MAIPTFLTPGAFAHTTGSPLTTNFPASLQADDILFLVTEVRQADTTPTASGFTQITTDSTTGGGTTTNTKLTTFWQRWASGTSVSVVSAAADHIATRCFGVRGCPTTGNPWSVTSHGVQSTATTAFSATGATTTDADCLVVVVGSNPADTATAQFSGEANADLASLTEQSDDFTTDGDGGGFALYTGTKAVAGAYGATTATLSTSQKFAFMTIAFKPLGSVVTTHNPLLLTGVG